MKLSTKGRYAVMAMVDIAAYGRGHPTALAQVAERQDISLSYLEQLFAKLRRAGLVRSARGPGGGYLLARKPGEIAIDEIVRAVDEPLHATRCTPGHAFGCANGGARCLTHDLWAGLGEQIQGYLASVTIADVLTRQLGRPRAAAE